MDLSAPGLLGQSDDLAGSKGQGEGDPAPTSNGIACEMQPMAAAASPATKGQSAQEEPFRSALVWFAPQNSSFALNAFVHGSLIALGQYASKTAVRSAHKKLVSFLGES
jgi:hypothetical protein